MIFKLFELFLLKLKFDSLRQLLNILRLAHSVEFVNVHLIAPIIKVRLKGLLGLTFPDI